MLAINKWDAVDRGMETTERFRRPAREFHFAPWLTSHYTSAKNRRNVDDALADAARRRHPTDTCRRPTYRMLVEAIGSHPPPTVRGKEVRFHHVTQADAPLRPSCSRGPARPRHFSYQRYLGDKIREKFPFRARHPAQFRGARD